MPRYLKGVCHECKGTMKFDIGDLTVPDALAVMEKAEGGECRASILPHVFLGGLSKMYTLVRDANGPIVTEEPDERPSDAEYLAGLKAGGKTVAKIHGNGELPGFDQFQAGEMRHLGWGEFENDRYRFVRHDTPRGERFYVVEEKA